MTTTSLHGDNTAIVPTLPPKSVQCIVTSPPYYGLRSYGIPQTDWPAVEYAPMAGLDTITIPPMSCCLGLESTPAAYIGHLVYTWRLLREVLRDDGICWLNLGDSYIANTTGKMGNSGLGGGKTTQLVGGNRPNKQAPGLKPKDLIGIPWRVAFALQADGWYLRSDVIWAKPNPMPESVTDRPTKAHEYVFLLSKNERYFYDADALREPTAAPRKSGANALRGQVEIRPRGNLQSLDEQSYNPMGRNRRTVWTIATQPYSGAHFAVMPEALIEPCILAGSAAQACEVCGAPWVRVVERTPMVIDRSNRTHEMGRTRSSGTMVEPPTSTTIGFRPSCACANIGSARSVVLDPYGGSGTVGRVAARLQRDAVLIDLNPDYIELQTERTDKVQLELFV